MTQTREFPLYNYLESVKTRGEIALGLTRLTLVSLQLLFETKRLSFQSRITEPGSI
jgi:hypothetical protein